MVRVSCPLYKHEWLNEFREAGNGTAPALPTTFFGSPTVDLLTHIVLTLDMSNPGPAAWDSCYADLSQSNTRELSRDPRILELGIVLGFWIRHAFSEYDTHLIEHGQQIFCFVLIKTLDDWNGPLALHKMNGNTVLAVFFPARAFTATDIKWPLFDGNLRLV